ncbi:MAG: hypothetical protein ACPG06_03210 [Alphaproteobacteria bacterium]
MVKTALRKLSNFGPLLFAFGFLTPLFAAIIAQLSIPLPFDIAPLLAGFVIAGVWGLIAQTTGRWI